MIFSTGICLADTEGTKDIPDGYIPVYSKYDLDNIRNDLDANYILMNDIEFTDEDFSEEGDFYNNGEGWIPIGIDNNSPFSGRFNGNGFNIDNLKINVTKGELEYYYYGLFGYATGEIYDLGMTNSNYSIKTFSVYMFVGTIIGLSENDISGCYSDGKISVESTSLTDNNIIVGGIVGRVGNRNDGSKNINIRNCTNKCDVTIISNITSTESLDDYSYAYAGGVIGYPCAATVSGCKNEGNVYVYYDGKNYMGLHSGGIMGTATGYSQFVDRCYNNGKITTLAPNARITDGDAGGITGTISSLTEITKCYNTGTIISMHKSGGIFGDSYNDAECEIIDCFNIGSIFSETFAGGIGSNTGGIISNCYNVGTVEGKMYYGGIIGFDIGGKAIITNCYYWDIVDRGAWNDYDKAIKCDINALKQSNTYEGFDFENDWSQSSDINYAFPTLKYVDLVFEKELSAIRINTLPTKLQYLEGKDTLDVSGGVIDLIYNNGDIETESLEIDMIADFDNSKVGKQTLTVNYNSKICNYDVEIVEKSVVSIAVTTKPDKLEYYEGYAFDKTGMVVTAYYNNDTNEEIYDYTISGYSSTIGAKTVYITYGDQSDSFTVVVNSICLLNGHKYDYSCDNSCNVCNEIRDAAHNYYIVETVYPNTLATSKDGYYMKECLVCGKVVKDVIYTVGKVTLSNSKYTYNGNKKTPTVTVTDSKGNVISNSNYAVSYSSGRVKVGRYKITVTFKGIYTGTKAKTAYFTIVPKAPSSATAKLRTVSGGYDDIKFSWSKATGASGYNVYYKKSTSSSYTYLTRTTATSYTKKNLTDGVRYYFKVVPYYKSGDTRYSSLSYKTANIFTLKKISTPKVTKSGTKVKVSWTNINGETGYQISKSTKKTGTNIVSTYRTTTGSYKTVSATKGKTYYYKVRAYKDVDSKKVYGPWSSVKAYKRK